MTLITQDHNFPLPRLEKNSPSFIIFITFFFTCSF